MSERELFVAALHLTDPVARAAFLDQACRADRPLRDRVQSLLIEHDKMGSFLEAPAAAPPADAGTREFGPPPVDATHTFGSPSDAEATADYPGRDEQAGAVIGGKYTLVEPIGEGGMGAVWRAKQTEPVKRFVAVKVIKAGMDSKQVLARFEAERQALALMDHPNIAKVLDGGLHEGRPFFVMELVKGVPITEYCDHHKLTPRQRLELFVPVCQAIQHAHQKGVIHRDIKPSNVLVALYDDKPVVKVIDFGVAKATGAALTERTIDTGFGGVVGTPEYMSPEQATFNNLDIDTRSDVYALGVLLYELLTGSPPFARRELEKRGLLEMLRVVREEEPPRPSTKLSTAEALPTLSANRGTEPNKLTGLLRNELDWIVMKALEKDRARRYETANGFAADVLRFLSGEPVQAHPPSTAYRLKKFVRRNRAQVIATGLVFAALVAGIVGTALGLREANRQAEIARGETAEKEKARLAETERVAERDTALKAEAERVRERDAALKAEAERADELKHRLGVSEMVLATAAYDGRDFGLAAERLYAVPAGQRGWEWRYMKRQLAGGIFTLRGHKGPVTCVAFSPDGTRIVTGGGRENTPFEAKVWDARTGTHLFDLKGLPVISGGFFIPVVCVAFSADGTRIVTAGGDTKARVWDAATGALRLELAETEGEVKCAAFSPDGTRIATGCEDGKAGLVKVWDAQSGKPVRDWKAHKSDVRRLSFSQDGTRILTGGADHAVKVWDAQTGKNLLEAKGAMSTISGVAFSPDATRIVTGREDGTARVIDSRTGEVLLVLRGRPRVVPTITLPTLGVRSVAFSPDGTRIVTAGAGTGETSVWDARTGVELLELKSDTGFAISAAFSPDGERVITGSADSTVKVWDARTGTHRLELNGIKSPIQSAAMSADGAWIVTGSGEPGREFADFGEATVWDARTGTVKHVLKGFKGPVNSVAISRDGTRIITGGGTFENLPAGTDAGEVTVRDTATGKPLLELKGLKEPVGSVSISPDGMRIVTAGYRGLDGFTTGGGNELKVWEAKTGTLLLDLTQPDAPPIRPTQIGERGGSVAFSPDGKRFFTAGVWHKNGLVKVWDARTGQVLVEMKGLTSPVLGVAYSPDGTRVATAGYNKTATIWDAETGTALVELKGHITEVNCLAFSPDGKRIVTGSSDRTVRVWDARTGTTLAELKAHGGAVTSVSFSADGNQILAGGRGDHGKPAEVFLWSAPAHSQEVGLVGHTDWIEGVAFSPDGTRIATGSGDKTVKVWDTRTGALLLDLKGHKDAVRHVAFSADGSRILAGGNQPPAPALGGVDRATVKVWDGRTGAEIVELKTGNHKIANFSTDGTRIVTEGYDEIRKVWDVKTGTELPGEPIPTSVLAERTSPDGRLFARLDGNRAEVISMVPSEEELAYRRLHTRPNPSRYRSGYLVARVAKDEFAAAFYLNLVPPDERTALVAKADAEALASLSNRAHEHIGAGEPELAVPLFVEILKVKKAKFGLEDPGTLETITLLAGLYGQMRQFDKSIPLFEELLKVQEAKHGRDSIETIKALVNVAVINREAGRLKEAILLLEEAKPAAKKYPKFGRMVTGQLIDIYNQVGENAKAAVLHLEMLPEVRKLLPKESPVLAQELEPIGLALLQAKVFAEAEPLLRECLAIREKMLPDFWATFNTQSLLGGVLLGQKKYADAEPLLVKGYEGMKAREKTIPPQGVTRLPDALDRLIELYTATNKPDEVKKYRDLRANYPTAQEVAPPPREKQ